MNFSLSLFCFSGCELFVPFSSSNNLPKNHLALLKVDFEVDQGKETSGDTRAAFENAKEGKSFLGGALAQAPPSSRACCCEKSNQFSVRICLSLSVE